MPIDRPTDVGNFGEAVYEQLNPLAWDDPDKAWALLCFIGSLGQMFQDLDDLAHGGPNGEIPWSILLDLDRIPAIGLPWLGQFIGVVIDTSLTENQQKQQIRDHLAWGRGTIEALRAAARPFLTGTQTVLITERNGSAWQILVNTYDTETPGTFNWTYQTLYNNYTTYENLYLAQPQYADIYAFSLGLDPKILAALLKAKVAGLILTYAILSTAPGAISRSVYALFNTYQDVYNAYQTYQDLYSDDSTY